jgi:hypothetical protein
MLLYSLLSIRDILKKEMKLRFIYNKIRFIVQISKIQNFEMQF